MTKTPRVVLLATLDTKSDEASLLRDEVRRQGCEVCVVDLSLRGPDQRTDAAITRGEVALAAGCAVKDIERMARSDAMQAVARGARALVTAMVERNEAQSVVGIGGGTGTWLSEAVVADLPHGFGKIIVSTLVGRDASRDITVMPSVVDIAGVNSLLRPVLRNAAAAACGMARLTREVAGAQTRRVALTMFGVTTAGADHARSALESAGCEVVVFHANGVGGQTMERLTREGLFDAVLDWTTSEVTDELVGGICTAGQDRLRAAGAAGIPQVVVPGAVDVINVAGEIPPTFADRVHHWHLPTVPLIRTSSAESFEVGAWIADRLNAARGPVHVLVPERGYSAIDAPGGDFEDSEADEAWVSGLRSRLDPDIPVELVDAHINDQSFAQTAARRLLELFELIPAAETTTTEESV